MTDKTLHEIIREKTKANPTIMKHIQEAQNAFIKRLERNVALHAALTPSDEYLDEQAIILEGAIKKMGIADELVRLTAMHEEEITKIEKEITEVLSRGRENNAQLD